MNSKFGKYIGNERDYIDRYLDTETKENKNFPWVAEFEREFTKISGAKYAIAVSSATAGLSALEACNLEPDDEVISHWAYSHDECICNDKKWSYSCLC